METHEEIEAQEGVEDGVIPLPSENGDGSVMGELRQKREAKQPYGRTKILEVPGYEGKLGIQYKYITSEVTEAIGKAIARELRNVPGRRGATLLASLDTLSAACERAMIRDSAQGKWRPMKPDPVMFDVSERPDGTPIASVLKYDARDGRQAVLQLFGEEHAIINQYVVLSRWLGDTSRTEDEDFLEL